MSRLHQHPRAGFSLIEIVIAMLVLGVAVVGLTEGVTVALRSNKESELQSTAALFASGVSETLRAEGDFENGETEGDCGDDLALYRWKQTIKDASLDGLHEVTVTVENSKSGKEIYELQTMLFQASDAMISTNSTRRQDTDVRKRRNQ